MSSLIQGRAYRLGETVLYGSIYGYRKNRVMLLDAATGDNVGWIKEEVVPGLPGQPDITCHYEKNGWRQISGIEPYRAIGCQNHASSFNGKTNSLRGRPGEVRA